MELRQKPIELLLQLDGRVLAFLLKLEHPAFDRGVHVVVAEVVRRCAARVCLDRRFAHLTPLSVVLTRTQRQTHRADSIDKAEQAAPRPLLAGFRVRAATAARRFDSILLVRVQNALVLLVRA